MFKSFVETLTPYNQILIFEEHLCPIWIFIFDTDQSKINSVPIGANKQHAWVCKKFTQISCSYSVNIWLG